MTVEQYLKTKGYLDKYRGFNNLVRLLKEYLVQNNRYQPIRIYIEDIIEKDKQGSYSTFYSNIRYYLTKRYKIKDMKQEILDLYTEALIVVNDLHN